MRWNYDMHDTQFCATKLLQDSIYRHCIKFKPLWIWPNFADIKHGKKNMSFYRSYFLYQQMPMDYFRFVV